MKWIGLCIVLFSIYLVRLNRKALVELQIKQKSLLEAHETVVKSLKRSNDIMYKLGYSQGKIDEMTEIMTLTEVRTNK